MGQERRRTLAEDEEAAKAIRAVPDAIAPFPGGIARSGSKVGSKYKKVPASTNDAYCPTLRGAVKSALDPDIAAVLEIVIDGLTPAAVAAAMRRDCRGGEARSQPRRRAHRRGELRRQARASSLPFEGHVAVRPLVLALRQRPDQRLDLSPLVPHLLAGKAAAPIQRIELQTTKHRR